MFVVFRFLAGAGIGGEYSAINSAIDELVPARIRGQIDLGINGSYWVGVALGAGVTLVVLDPALCPGRRSAGALAFGLGAILGLAILLRPPRRAGEPALAAQPRPRRAPPMRR